MSYLALTIPGANGAGIIIKSPNGIPDPSNVTVAKIIGNTITIMLIIAILLSLIYLILGGIMWISSGGDKSKVAAALSRLTAAIIGLILALVAFFIVNIVSNFFGVNVLTLNF